TLLNKELEETLRSFPTREDLDCTLNVGETERRSLSLSGTLADRTIPSNCSGPTISTSNSSSSTRFPLTKISGTLMLVEGAAGALAAWPRKLGKDIKPEK